MNGPDGVELHVLSHEDLRLQAPEVSSWEQTHKFSQSSACMKIPKFPGCGNPVCDQPDHPQDQCRYNSDSGCSCVSPGGQPCADTANLPQERVGFLYRSVNVTLVPARAGLNRVLSEREFLFPARR